MNLAPLRRAAFVTGCVGALSAGLLVAGCVGSTAAGSAPSVTAAATSAATATSAAPARVAASIPGRRYYTEEKPARIARLDGDKLVTVLTGGASRSAVASPDGQHTAWVTDVAPPEDGAVSGAEFGPEGSMLYRMEQDDAYTLVLQDAGGRTVGRFPEPASVRDMSLIGYTR
jgi:ABC-type Fe3+-hydroxamate transport system substrate-binding protein